MFKVVRKDNILNFQFYGESEAETVYGVTDSRDDIYFLTYTDGYWVWEESTNFVPLDKA